MRRQKKGALELSINSIVIIIIAMTLLGLGLGFVRNFFASAGDTQDAVLGQMREQILDDLRRGDKKLSFPSNQISVESGDEAVLVVGVKNVNPSQLAFKIELQEVGDNGGQTIDSSADIPSGEAFSFFWDTTAQTLEAGEANVYPITLASANSASGTKLFKVIITETTGNTEYTSKSFFVKFI